LLVTRVHHVAVHARFGLTRTLPDYAARYVYAVWLRAHYTAFGPRSRGARLGYTRSHVTFARAHVCFACLVVTRFTRFALPTYAFGSRSLLVVRFRSRTLRFARIARCVVAVKFCTAWFARALRWLRFCCGSFTLVCCCTFLRFAVTLRYLRWFWFRLHGHACAPAVLRARLHCVTRFALIRTLRLRFTSSPRYTLVYARLPRTTRLFLQFFAAVGSGSLRFTVWLQTRLDALVAYALLV